MISKQAILRGYNRGNYVIGAPTPPHYASSVEDIGSEAGLAIDAVHVSEDLIERLRGVADEVLTSRDDFVANTRDWWAGTMLAETSGTPAVIDGVFVRISTVEQVQAVMRLAHAAKVPLTVSAGRSNVTGAALPLRGGIVLDVCGLNRFVGFDAYQKAIDSGVDVVILTSQPHFRPIHFEYAVQQGKHVFMEKPVATDSPGIRRVLAAAEAAKEKNLKVGVGFQRHHDAVYTETVGRLLDGAVGKINHLRCYWNSSGARQPFVKEPGMTEMYYQLRSAYYFTWLSGDHIVEQHVHNIDVCNWIMGSHPVTAQGQGGRQVRIGPLVGDIFDHHFVEYTYPDGTRMFSQCRHIPGCWNQVAEFVAGSKGQSDVGGGKIETDGDSWTYRGPKQNPYQVEHDVLFDAIRNDRPHNEAEYGATTTMTAIMGRMATYSGQVIPWDDALQSKVSLAPDRYDWDGTPSVVAGEDDLYPCATPGVTRFF